MTGPSNELTLWRRVVEDDALVEAARHAACTPAEVARLRKGWDAELVAIALELAAARVRAARKFPKAANLIADRAGVEQATSARVAAHKAERFRAVSSAADLCCGIGGDAMALAAVLDPGALEAVDRSDVRTWMTTTNAGCGGRAADVSDVDNLSMDCASFHVDPARRDEASGRRSWDPEALQPGLATLAALRDRWPAGAIKLGPGLDAQGLAVIDGTEVEFIAEAGTMVQAVAWHGALAQAPGCHVATHLLADGGVRTLTGSPRPLDESETLDLRPDRSLLVPDVALERAGLVEHRRAGVDARGVHPGLGLLVAHERCNDPWFKEFHVLAVVPWRDRALRAALRDLDAGRVVVRTRGGAVEPDRWTRRLGGSGARERTVFGLRLGRSIVGVITEMPRNSCAETDGSATKCDNDLARDGASG